MTAKEIQAAIDLKNSYKAAAMDLCNKYRNRDQQFPVRRDILRFRVRQLLEAAGANVTYINRILVVTERGVTV